jgi:hypothetical protein
MMSQGEMDAGGPPNKKPKIGSQTSLSLNGGGSALNTQMSESTGKLILESRPLFAHFFVFCYMEKHDSAKKKFPVGPPLFEI